MKSLSFLLTLTLLPIGLSVAQTTPASTTVTSTSTNRQQELYDEHHGITKKPKTTPAATKPTTSATSSTDRTPTTPRIDEPASTQPTIATDKPQQVSGTSSTSNVRIGIRGGVTSSVFTQAETGVKPALGFVGGISFTFGSGTVSFQPEINYSRYAQKVTDFGFTDTQAVDVLEVPLFLKFSTGTYAGSRFFLNVGPYAGYRMNISQNGKTISLDGTKGRFGFGAGAGIGTAIKAGPGHVTLEIRGLYPLGDVDNGFNTDSQRIFAQGTIGYIVQLGGR
ncbi:porin family protein [Spirosoma pollinicola]|uniref:Outer membrane protein beta-barrel domain-containing protein n=1 Tax=Spirosoma pollinicola TaxID=2057025 RepID=A0A2K8Z8R7_9BACT|nr:porin family protein [Spirosoma pollinicola]AUD06258.1 hypothetical protein CWM47_33085 [Spirosoma pollinicola]